MVNGPHEQADIRAVEFTPGSDGENVILPDVLDQIPEGEEFGTVIADGACDIHFWTG